MAAHGKEAAELPQHLTTALLIPSYRRWLAVGGLSLTREGLVFDGLNAQLGVLVAPWGRHHETPFRSGFSPALFGVQAWLRTRYQLGGSGFFVGVQSRGEYLSIRYQGIGTRESLDGSAHVGSLGPARERRLSWSAILSVGYVWRSSPSTSR